MKKIKEKAKLSYKYFSALIKTNSDIFLVTIVGFVIRIVQITKEDFWYDEAFTGLMMRIPMRQLAQILHEDPHPPLYFLINKFWCVLLGVNDLSLRLLPLVFGILTIIAVYFLAKSLFSKETGVIAAVICAINPFLVGYSIEARSYSLYSFLVVATAYFAYKRRLNFLIIGITLLIFTHYMSLAYIPIFLLYYVYIVIRYKHSIKVGLLRLVLLSAAFLFIYNFGILSSIKNQNIDWAEKATLNNVVKSIASYTYGVKIKLPGKSQINDLNLPINQQVLIYGLAVLYFTGLIIVFIKNRKNPENIMKTIYVLSLIFVPQLILIIYGSISNKTLYVERYLIPSSIFLIISYAVILKKLLRIEYIIGIIFLYVFVISRIQNPNYYSGMKLLVDDFREFNGEVVFTSPVDYTVGRYYFGSITGNDYLDLTEDNIYRIKLFDPQHPDWTYTTWWFVNEQTHYPNWSNAVIFSPDSKRMTSDFRKVSETKYGNYEVYTKTNP